MRRRLPFLIPALAAAIGAPLIAADTAPEANLEQLRQQVAALAAQVEKLQKEKPGTPDLDSVRDDLQVFKDTYARDKERNLVTNQNGRYVGVFGTLQTRLSALSLADPRGASQVGVDIPLASIGLRGILYRDYSGGRNLEAVVTLQTIRTTASYINVNQNLVARDWVGDNSAANTAIALADTYIRYNFLPTNDLEGARLAATFGQFIPKFGLEGSAPENLKPTIRGALLSTASVPRQLGLELAGDLAPSTDFGYDYRAPLLAYWIALTNGAGGYTANNYGQKVNAAGTGLTAATSDPTLVNATPGTNANDANTPKALTARIEFIPPHDYNSLLRQIKIGASLAFDRSSGTATALTAPTGAAAGVVAIYTAANAANPAGKLLEYDLHRRFGFDVSYAHSPISVTYEAVYSSDSTTTSYVDPAKTLAQNRANGFQRTTSVDGFGQAVTLGYIFGDQFLSNNVRDGGKWDDAWPQSFQPYVRYDTWNPNVEEDHQVRSVSIGANLFFAQTTKFQIQASRITSQIADGESWNEVLAQFQYGF